MRIHDDGDSRARRLGLRQRRNVVHTPFVKKIFSIPLAGSGEKCEQTMEYLLATNKPLFALGMKMKVKLLAQGFAECRERALRPHLLQT